jgi:hypothetical protein
MPAAPDPPLEAGDGGALSGREDDGSTALWPSMEAEPAHGSNRECQAWWRRRKFGERS